MDDGGSLGDGLFGGHRLERHRDHMLIRLAQPCRILSSAVLNGGLVSATYLLNMRVPENKSADVGAHAEPEDTLEAYARGLGLAGPVVGMMTGAHMQSIQVRTACEAGVDIAIALTSGLSNARRAGDAADARVWFKTDLPAGTINIALVTSATLPPAAMAECLMIVTEAKTAALADAGVNSPVSGRPATGTGTDATAIISGGGAAVRYCGKHTRFGELAAQAVIAALSASIAWHWRDRP